MYFVDATFVLDTSNLEITITPIAKKCAFNGDRSKSESKLWEIDRCRHFENCTKLGRTVLSTFELLERQVG